MDGQKLVLRLIGDIENSIAGRAKINDYDEIVNCLDGAINFKRAGGIYQKFSIAHAYDCQLRYEAMKLALFIGKDNKGQELMDYKPGQAANLPALLNIIKSEKSNIATRFDTYKVSASIDSIYANHFRYLMRVLDCIHSLADEILKDVEMIN